MVVNRADGQTEAVRALNFVDNGGFRAERSPMDPGFGWRGYRYFTTSIHRRLLASLKATGCDASNEVILSSAWVDPCDSFTSCCRDR